MRNFLSGLANKGTPVPVITVGTTAPTSPANGDVWFDLNETVDAQAAGVSEALALAYAVVL